MPQKEKLMLVTGGAWHDFDGFCGFAQPLFEGLGWSVRRVESDIQPAGLKPGDPRCILIYTSLGGATDNAGRTGADFTPQQVDSLVRWVRNGGGLVALHCASVDNSNPPYKALIGGRFVSHPDAFVFTVSPTALRHPVTDGVGTFNVRDEFYIQEYAGDIKVLMTAVFQDRSYPMVWVRYEGKGRVVYIAPGHFPEIWSAAAYQRLLIQAVQWACGG